MPIDNFNINGPTSSSKNDKKTANLYPHPVLARVKNNTDAARTGAIWVYVIDQGAEDSDDDNSWVQVRYSSPFYGTTKPAASGPDNGDFVGNPHSYGFWASAPDVGTKVICVFLNGSPNFGYYIGCVPEPERLFMVPAIGASSSVTVNAGEGESYGGVDRLPVTNLNVKNEKISESSNFLNEAKPVHSYVAAILNKQGLLRDKHRGVIGSSAQRESPSRVFGVSTPGRPIFEGGFTDQTIASALASEGADKLKVVGRRGGHSLVLDDGDILGEDQLVRLRTGLGHQIMMNDTSQTLTLIHSNGQSWIELGAEGTVDVYSSNSVNIRTQGDLNLHADRDINMHAGKKVNIKSEELNANTDKNINFRSALNTSFYSQGTFGVSVDGAMSFLSSGESSFKSESTTFINGSRINLETGSASFVPPKTNPIDTTLHDDTIFDPAKGFLAIPLKLESITSRAPTHFPWKNAGKGIDVKIDFAPAPPEPSPEVESATTPTETPEVKASPSILATVPAVAKVDAVKSAIVSQTAVTAAVGSAKDAVAKGAAVVTSAAGLPTVAVGALGTTVEQLATPAAGVLKPGADIAVKAALAAGKSATEALSPAFFTGNNGVKSLTDFTKNVVGQVGVMSKMIDKSISDLTKMNVFKGGEALSKIAGTVTAAITAGVKNVANLIKNPIGALSKIPGVGAIMGSIKKAVNLGGFASKLADSIKGGLPDPAKIAGDIPKLTPGKPLDLIKENAPKSVKDISAKLTGAVSGVTGAVSGVTGAVSGVTGAVTGALGKITGGINSAVSGVTGGINSAVSGVTGAVSGATGGINSAVSGVTGALGKVTGAAGAVSGALGKVTGAAGAALSKVTGAAGALGALAGKIPSAGDLLSKLDKPDFGDLDKAIGEVGLGLPGGLKLPQAVSGTLNVDSMLAQSKNLLGNAKIPPIPFKAPDNATLADQRAKLDDLNNKIKELNKASDEATAARKEYQATKEKYGLDATQTAEAQQTWDAALAKMKAAKQAANSAAG